MNHYTELCEAINHRKIKRLTLENRYTEFCVTVSRCNVQIDAHSDVFEILRNYVKYKVDFDVLYYDKLTFMANEIRDMYRQLKLNILEDFKEFYELNRDFYQNELGLYLYRRKDMQTD